MQDHIDQLLEEVRKKSRFSYSLIYFTNIEDDGLGKF